MIEMEMYKEFSWMRRIPFLLVMFMNFLFLTSCSNEQYPSIAEDANVAITVNLKDMTISFINIDTKKELEEWKMEKPYIGGIILPDGDSFLLYGKQIDTVDIFSLKQGKMISSWRTGKGIVSGKVLENGEEIVFADQSMNTVRFYSLDGLELATVKTDSGPLTLLEEDETLYIVSYTSGTMTKLDIGQKKIVDSFSIHPSATGALLKNQNEIWIGGHGEGTELENDIHVYETRSGKLLRTIPAPVMPINFSQNDDYVYVLSHGSNMLYQLDKGGVAVNSTKIGANPFELKTYADYIIVAGYDSNDVHLVHYETLNIVKSIPVGKGPFQLIIRERVIGEQS